MLGFIQYFERKFSGLVAINGVAGRLFIIFKG
jgi:hypothetical protein